MEKATLTIESSIDTAEAQTPRAPDALLAVGPLAEGMGLPGLRARGGDRGGRVPTELWVLRAARVLLPEAGGEAR